MINGEQNGFKLIGIVPLKDCDERFLKNLKIGEIYKFYQNYDLRYSHESDSISLQENDKIDTHSTIYNLNNGVKVNVSAVVGFNGSGKSSLIELLYYFIYAVSTISLFDDKRLIEKYSDQLNDSFQKHEDFESELRSNRSIFFAAKIQNRLKLLFKDFNDHEFERINNDDLFMDELLRLISKKKEKIFFQRDDDLKIDREIEEKLKVAVVYENADGLFSVKYKNKAIEIETLKQYSANKIREEDFNIEDFFYTISLNYSHHSLNNKTIGNWINTLFHKNDAYSTPVVINPMRVDGNYDVNRELALNNERLMGTLIYNISRNSEYKLIEKYEIKQFVFRVKRSIIPVFCINLENRSVTLQKYNQALLKSTNPETRIELSKEKYNQLDSVVLIKKILNIDNFEEDIPFLNYAIGYLEKKLPKLKDTYKQFFPLKEGKVDEDQFQVFIEEDNSHITKKIRQTLNFLKVLHAKKDTHWENPLDYTIHEFNLDEIKQWLNINDSDYKNKSPLELLEYSMPGFCNVDFKIGIKNQPDFELSKLSSGEQQMIFNINTIIYHLLNLQSVFGSENMGENKKRLTYSSVSIILDEIELYFHPEMQRELINNLLNELEKIKTTAKGISSINICFLTHSPFILSDIPNSNIMRLTLDSNGRSVVQNVDNETFGANIHDLLANDFFLKKGFIGEFAKRKINEVITFLNHKKIDWKISVTDKSKDTLSGKKLRKSKENLPSISESLTLEKCEHIILLIGEPAIRETLLKQYYEIIESDEEKVDEFLVNMAKRLNYTLKKN